MPLETKIKKILTGEFQRNQMQLKELMALLYILGQANSQEELISLVHIFSSTIPSLHDVEEMQRSDNKKQLESEAEELIRSIIMTNPIEAADMATMAMKGASVAEIKNKYSNLFN